MLFEPFVEEETGYLDGQYRVLELHRYDRFEPGLENFFIVLAEVIFYYFEAICPNCLVILRHCDLSNFLVFLYVTSFASFSFDIAKMHQKISFYDEK